MDLVIKSDGPWGTTDESTLSFVLAALVELTNSIPDHQGWPVNTGGGNSQW